MISIDKCQKTHDMEVFASFCFVLSLTCFLPFLHYFLVSFLSLDALINSNVIFRSNVIFNSNIIFNSNVVFNSNVIQGKVSTSVLLRYKAKKKFAEMSAN